ncbi:MAG: hypothetical protein CVU57_29570 [Deltaproteobacteria bacterium HGW-Deltaproteobacteria-15]|nr:MAG: hypothetical protein CVU57_29570 [Deltaproteobacteria bacterium HGW-Deltaproteobacteria-15]PKO01692.1 MAG: hypothetical protein CVU43_11765 [Chloroflexi bacterium HGW-Chloroflexi-5]
MRYPFQCIRHLPTLLILFTAILNFAVEPLHAADLILDGNDVLVIENQTYIHTGNIYLKDNAKLTLRNATLIVNISYHEEFDIYVSDNAILEVDNSTIKTPISDEIQRVILIGSPELYFRNSNLNEGLVYIAAGIEGGLYDESKLFTGSVIISGSTIHNISLNFSPEGGGLVSVKDVRLGTFTLRFNNNYQGQFSHLKPGLFASWSYTENNYNIALINTQIDMLIAACDGPSKIIVRDCEFHQFAPTTPSAAIQMTAIDSKIRQVPLHGLMDIEARLWGLKKGHYDDWLLSDHSTVTRGELPWLRLRNTDVTDWWMVSSFANSDITIEDSTLEFRVYSDNSHTKIKNSRIVYRLMLYCAENSTVEFEKTIVENISVYVPPISATIKGDITFPSSARLVDWYGPSTVTRRYPVACGVPSAALKLYSKDGALVWSGFTNSAGNGEFGIRFNDNNHSDVWSLSVSYGGKIVDTAVHLLTSTPILLTGQFPPPPPAPKVTPTPAVILLLGE